MLQKSSEVLVRQWQGGIEAMQQRDALLGSIQKEAQEARDEANRAIHEATTVRQASEARSQKIIELQENLEETTANLQKKTSDMNRVEDELESTKKQNKLLSRPKKSGFLPSIIL